MDEIPEAEIQQLEGSLRSAAELILKRRVGIAEALSAATSGADSPTEILSSLDDPKDAFDLRFLVALHLAESALSAAHGDVPDIEQVTRLVNIIGECSRTLLEYEDMEYWELIEASGDQHELSVAMVSQWKQLFRDLKVVSRAVQRKPLPRPWDGLVTKRQSRSKKNVSELEHIVSSTIAAIPSDSYFERMMYTNLHEGLQLPNPLEGSPEFCKWLALSESAQEKILRDARRTLAYWSVASAAVHDRENQPSPLGALVWGLQVDVDVPPWDRPMSRTWLHKELRRLRDLWSVVVAHDPYMTFWVAKNCFGSAHVSEAVEAIIGFAKPGAEWKAPSGNKARSRDAMVREWQCSGCLRRYAPGDHSHDSPLAAITKYSIDVSSPNKYATYHRVLYGLPKKAKPWSRLLALCLDDGPPCWTKGGVLVPIFEI